MTDSQMQEYTRRITQANRSGLVLIKFEMLFTYLDDACGAFRADDREGFKSSLRHADAVLKSFQDTLDFSYEISARLYSVYDFHRRQLAKAMMRHSLEEIESSRKLLDSTYQAFSGVAGEDVSKPLMRNAQQVYAGYTYGKNDLNESYDVQSSRGFLV